MAQTPTATPEHPGTYVQREVLPEGTTVTEAAKRLGIGRPALSRFLNGKSSLSPKMAQRLQREFGVDPAHIHDMQTRFDNHEARVRRNAAEQRPIPLSVATIKADEIDRWAGEHQARQELAVLLRRLVHSTTDGVKRADFPGYGQAEREGWDGRIEAAATSAWVPEGASRWEFTCNNRPRSRADHYFTARTESVPPEDRQAQAFVFVTPHNWPSKTEWEDEKRRLNEWREVRAYDASDLEQWLETSPAAQVWFAERLGRPVEGFQSLDQFWNEWAAAADPPLSPTLFAAAIDKHSKDFFGWLQEDPDRLFTIAADSRQEAIAFLACFLKAECLPPDRMLDQAVVFHRVDAVQRLNSLMGHHSNSSAHDRLSIPLLAVAGTLDVEQSLAAWREACHCVAPQHRNSVGLIDRRRDIELDILTPREFGKALASMNISGTRVDQLALDTARSPTILRRRLSTTPGSQRAGWAHDEDALEAAAVPALIGAWNGGAEADRDALALLADTDYGQVARSVSRLRNREDPPVWSIGKYHGVCSRVDALFSVAPAVTTKNLDDFFFLAEYILSERDPKLDLPAESRWKAAVYGKVRNHSDALRTGIRETLILLAEYGSRLFDERLSDNTEQRVETFVRRLLDPLTSERLLSHKADFPDYAEAAPDAVLDLLTEDLEVSEPAALEILKSQEGDPLFQGCPRTGLLWALEALAWLPGRLPRVANVLAQLSEREITDRWTNTPFNTLVSLFRTWMPQTLARLPDRLHVLDSIVHSRPRVGWRLCVELLPKHHDTSDLNRLPKWRGDTSLARVRPPAREIREAAEAARQTVFRWAAHDEETLGDLVDRVRSFPEGDRSRLWELIGEWGASASDHAKALLRDRIRKRYRSVHDERAKQAIQALVPANAVARNQWLFASTTWAVEWDESDTETSFEETLARVKTRREAGLREVLQERERGGLLELIESCEAPQLVGSTLAGILDPEAVGDMAVSFLSKATGAGETVYRECLEGLLALARPVVLERLVQHCRQSDDAASRLVLYLAMPCRSETWRLLGDEDQGLRESYWDRVRPPHGQRVTADELHELIDRLIGAKRPDVALWAAQYSLTAVETKRLQRLLRALAMNGGTPKPDSYTLGEAVEHLGNRVDVDESVLVEIELAFLPQLRHTEHGFPNLQKRLLRSPGLFVQAVALAFGPKSKGEDQSPWQVDDPAQRAAVGSAACQFLMNVQVVPGIRDDGQLDSEKLHAWLASARKMCAELDRAEVGDAMIGEWLARASAEDGVARPRTEVVEAIEWMASNDVDTGFRTGAFNARGVTMSFELGGDQDRVMAKRYRELAADMVEYPRMRRILEELARTYEDQAKRLDRSDEVGNRLPSVGPVFDV